jgi:DNA adenine methylase
MGAGGVYFNKPKATHNFLNDADNDVFNLWQLFQDEAKVDLLVEKWKEIPLGKHIFKWIKQQDFKDDVMRALRFLYLSNTSYLGAATSYAFGNFKAKQSLRNNYKQCYEYMQDAHIMNLDFRDVLKSINYRSDEERKRAFIYCDPPYLATGNSYSANKWTQKDTEDLFDVLVKSGLKFAISEFDNEVVLDLANKYDLFVYELERNAANLRSKKERVEILITNYKVDLEDKDKSLFNGE